MYDDRIEILNPGALYGINKIEKLGTDTIMEVRNPTIVRILEEKGSVIENRHSGIPTMRSEMQKYGLPNPEFYEERGSFKVIFKNHNEQQNAQSEQQNVQSGQQNAQSGQQNVQGGQQNVQSGQQNVQSGQQNVQGGQQNDLIQEYQTQLLAYCKEPKTSKEIANHLNIKSRTYISTYIIKPLINEGKLDYTNKKSINARNQKYITVK